MCGICGFIDFTGNTPRRVLEAMTETLSHRGPDGQGVQLFQSHSFSLGLGHRRLSIIDLSNNGSQPMQYRQWYIVFNGEIYNYQEIKEELRILGHVFVSGSDTEVVLHAFEEWGTQCLKRFIGMFAFFLYDEAKHQIFIGRDRAGVKPFFYYWKDGLFLFGSELKAILAHPRFNKVLNPEAVGLYLQYGYVPSPHCIFKNTYKLPAGHFATAELPFDALSLQQYWNVYDAYNKPLLQISFEEAKKHTTQLLESACQYRMVADVPVGVFLSGGYDSTAVTALLQQNRTDKIKTFTIGFQDQALNEAPYARQVAEVLGTDHTEYLCTEQEALEIVPTLPLHYDEPFADSSAIPTMLVSKIARQQVTVALSADAGDEVFAGYNRYDYILKFGGLVKKIPGVARKALASVMDTVDADSIPLFNKKYLFHSRYEKVKQFLRNSDDYNINQLLSRQFVPADLERLVRQNTSMPSTAFDSREMQQEYYSTLRYVMAVDYQTYLVDDILQKVDRATMAYSLEGREPLLDHRLIEWAAQLPDNFKYHNGTKKYILRQIVHDYVPRQLMERPKMGFAIPVSHWLEFALKPFVDQYLNESYLRRQAVFDEVEIKRMVDSFYLGKKERAEKLWHLLMFQMWYDQWIGIN